MVKKNAILNILILFLFSASSFISITNNKIYGTWKATNVYLGDELDTQMKDFNAEQSELLHSALDSLFIKDTWIEFAKDRSFKMHHMGIEFNGTWKKGKHFIKLESDKEADKNDPFVLEVHPDRLVYLMLPEKNVTITFTKEQ